MNINEVLPGKILICIGREAGAGGRRIGRLVAERLGVPFYDRELISVAANESGLCEEIMKSHEEKATRSFLYSLVMDTYSVGYRTTPLEMPMEQKVFLAEYNAIKAIAEQGSAVFVGRCADYALEGNPDLMTVFVQADMPDKIKHCQEDYDVTDKEAEDYIVKADKRRSNYYNYYSNKKWGDRNSYDLIVNRSTVGIDGAVETIINFAKLKKENDAKKA